MISYLHKVVLPILTQLEAEFYKILLVTIQI